MKIKAVATQDAPEPVGHYSQGTVHGGMVYISGQLPVEPHTVDKITGSIEDQTEQVLKNLAAILDAADSDPGHVVKVTVYISNIGLWDRVNAVYSRFFGEHRPARAVVPVGELHFDCQVEMEAIAVVKR